MMRVQLHGDAVAHGPRGHEQRGLLADYLRGATLQPVDRGVLAIDVVAYLGLEHGAAHGRGRPRDRVAPQIDERQIHQEMNSSKTSFDSRTPRPVSRRTSSLRSSNPSARKREIGAS